MSVRARLSAMMFLQFFIWGAWYTTIAVYMTNHGMETLTHWPYTVNPIAAIVAPFFLGLVADRYFATEKVLGVLHLLGAAVMLAVPRAAGAPVTFILLLLVYNLCYMPTLGLANSLAFHHIQSQEQQFPLIRVFGTIGWIVAGLFISLVLGGLVAAVPERTALPLYTAAGASALLGFYSFTLPHTPPPGAGQRVSLRSILGLDALAQLGDRAFYVFIAASLLLCIPLAAYYNFTQIFLGDAGVTRIAATQSLGQMSEVIFMLLMPLLFVRLGVKRMLMAGMAAWVLRYVLFAIAAPAAVFPLIIIGILLVQPVPRRRYPSPARPVAQLLGAARRVRRRGLALFRRAVSPGGRARARARDGRLRRSHHGTQTHLPAEIRGRRGRRRRLHDRAASRAGTRRAGTERQAQRRLHRGRRHGPQRREGHGRREHLRAVRR